MCGGGGGIGKAVGGIGKAIGGAVKGVVGAVKDVVKNPIFQAVAPIALNFFVPGLGLAATGALGLSAAWAPAIGGAISGGVFGALGGKGVKGALMGAAIGGISAGAADYLANGTNPLSGMFSGTEGGAATNALTAGGTGSTNLTGVGSGLGTNSSTLGTQFGQISPTATGNTLGSINPNVTGSFGSITPPTSSLTGSLGSTGSSGSGGFLSSLADKAKSLIPESTLGKVALGGAALSALGGGGGQAPAEAAPPPAAQDPTFTQHLDTWRYNPNAGNTRNITQDNAASFVNNAGRNQSKPNWGVSQPGQSMWTDTSGNAIDPQTGQPLSATAAAGGGRIPYYAMGGLTQYASGGMPDVATDHGYLQGPGDGVSDDIPAVIGDKQPARLAGGEFIIPARIVSELGNGSSDAGASRLQQMMDRVNKKRLSAKDFAKDTKAYNLLPA